MIVLLCAVRGFHRSMFSDCRFPSANEGGTWALGRFQRGNVAAEYKCCQPDRQNADLSFPCGYSENVVAAVHNPRRKSGNDYAPGLEHALTDSECRHYAEVLMNVFFGRLVAQGRHDVGSETFALPDRVLRI